jgi:HSP20 family protein
MESKSMEFRRFDKPMRRWDWFDGPDLFRWLEGGVRPFFGPEDRLRVEEELTDDTLVIRAEMPGLDPDKDVEITVGDGVLHVRAERRSESKEERQGQFRSEFHYGSFERMFRVPKDVVLEDVGATYRDGILEITVPYKVPTEAPPRKVPVAKA